MAEEIGKASGIEKFNGIDFGFWRMQIEDYLNRTDFFILIIFSGALII